MDLLSYDLVDHLVQFLPRTDLKTIAKAAYDRLELGNWKLIAERHLKERYFLNVDVYIPYENELETAPKRRKLEEGEKAGDEKETVLVFITRRSFTGGSADRWDFKRMQYASLGNVWIHSRGWLAHEQHRPYDVRKILPTLSLPVATRADSFVMGSLCIDSIPNSRSIDLALKMAQVVQKTFAKVSVWSSAIGAHLRADNFVRDYINHQAFLEDMRFSCSVFPRGKLPEDRIVLLFKERRTTPLTMQLPVDSLPYPKVQEILEHWKNSDGYVAGHRELRMPMFRNRWAALRRSWQNVRGYLPHPSKRSSLQFSTECFKIVKFEPWHSPIDFDWIESLIEDWKKSNGFFIFKGKGGVQLRMANEDWVKLVAKYGPTTRSKPGLLPTIHHPSKFGSLEIRKDRRQRTESAIEIGVILKYLSDAALRSLISKWKNGSGEFVVDMEQHKLKKIEISMDHHVFESFDNINDELEAFVQHPTANARLMIKEVGTDYRIVVVPIDAEVVDDWNLKLLFGSQ
ncbi:hypothetical protein QR680_016378 [Steinernema hermaphroditum]|uniref:Uncharacterized protein n=1 Tax=Steinernema hermaphroditum TaxID=289476 RepID=A0AA39HB18_9BILA|nr:hypothetical protein QR680_016378 [Steinernema hermaphroditum]